MLNYMFSPMIIPFPPVVAPVRDAGERRDTGRSRRAGGPGQGRESAGAVSGGVSPPPARATGRGHDRARRLSRYCCRMTTAAAWSITER